MNKLEAEYEAALKARLLAGAIAWYAYERVKLKLADNTFYTPDFIVMNSDGQIELHEVKGFWEDDARVKIKVAADAFPFAFIGVTKRLVRDGGGWAFEPF